MQTGNSTPAGRRKRKVAFAKSAENTYGIDIHIIALATQETQSSIFTRINK